MEKIKKNVRNRHEDAQMLKSGIDVKITNMFKLVGERWNNSLQK